MTVARERLIDIQATPYY